MRPLFPAVLLAWLLAWIPAPARAEPAPSELERNAAAVAAGRRGLEAYRLGDWAAAYQAFHEAEGTVHSPVFLLYMARVRQRQAATAEALDLYARVSAEPITETTPDAWIAAIRQGTLEGSELRARTTAPALPTAAPPRSEPLAQRTPQMRPKTGRRGDANRAAGITAGALGATGLAVGIVAGVVAWTKLNRLEEGCKSTGCDPNDEARLATVETWSRVADVGFLVAGTGLATAGVFLWLVPAISKDRTTPVSAGISTSWEF